MSAVLARATRQRAGLLGLLPALAGAAAACGTAASAAGHGAGPSTSPTKAMTEYVDGHWIPFTSSKPLTAAQWEVVDADANASSAARAVYATRSVAPLATVISPQSTVTAMFTRDLASGTDPEALSTTATAEAVAIHGCRARLALVLSCPGGRTLHDVSSSVRPFDRKFLATTSSPSARTRETHGTLAAVASTQVAPWLFVGDTRVGGVDTPCGICRRAPQGLSPPPAGSSPSRPTRQVRSSSARPAPSDRAPVAVTSKTGPEGPRTNHHMG